MATIRFTLNGNATEANYESGMHLLEVLREECGVVSAKNGCAPEGACGCCLVMIDGRPALSCLRKPEQMEGAQIVTLEGLGTRADPHPVQQAFIDEQAAQCGYCLNGMIIATKALLLRSPRPSDDEVMEALK